MNAKTILLAALSASFIGGAALATGTPVSPSRDFSADGAHSRTASIILDRLAAEDGHRIGD